MRQELDHSPEAQSKRARAPRTKIDSNGLMRAPGYTHEQIEHALVTLAWHGGDFQATERKLRAEDFHGEKGSITRGALKSWSQRFHERYEEIYEREIEKIQKRVAMRAEEAAVEAIQATHEGVERSRQILHKLAPKDVSGHARNMAVVAMGLNDKIIGPNRGRPTQRIEVRREPVEIMAELQSLFPGVIDSTAVEITEVTPEMEKAPSREPSPASEPRRGSGTP